MKKIQKSKEKYKWYILGSIINDMLPINENYSNYKKESIKEIAKKLYIKQKDVERALNVFSQLDPSFVDFLLEKKIHCPEYFYVIE